MRSLVFVVTTLLLLPAAMHGQSLMRMYRMVYSIGGSYSSGTTNTDLKLPSGTVGSDYEHETVQLATRNGYFVSRNFVLGMEFNWQQGRGETRPNPNPGSNRAIQFDRELFVGPLFRWYQPMTVRWFIYPEVSLGYQHFLGEYEESSSTNITLPATTTARGFGLNAGVGLGYFLSRNVVLDATVRYSRRWLTGEFQVPGQADFDVEISGGAVELLFGIQFMY
jgi:opacity protein-like surface antigen